MIKEIRFVQYKKLKDISIGFEAGLNAISGENTKEDMTHTSQPKTSSRLRFS